MFRFKSARAISFVLGCLLTSALSAAPQLDDWAVWRGPNLNGHAAGEQTPPVEWSQDKNVIWGVRIPGRGHASPTIVGDRIFLATCEGESQSVICLSRTDGTQLWQTTINQGGLPRRIHGNNTHASQTVVSDGERAFVVFYNNNRIQIAALDFEGNVLWDKNVGSYRGKYPFGFGSSPIIYGDNVIATSDNLAESGIVAFNRETGDEAWKIDRPQVTSYSTPVIAEISGKNQLLISGGNNVISYDADTQEELWRCPTAWEVSCATLVWDAENQMVFSSGGFPAQQTLAISSDSGDKLWENPTKSYEQSMIYIDGYLYTLTDRGVCYCWNGEDGTEMWAQRLEGGVSASPVYVGGNIYFTAESGTTYVVKANPSEFVLVAENELGSEAFATPSFVDNRVFARIGDSSGQQWLFCLGQDGG
ncbi:MAG: PQQ-binding-like beta-propeller repeat protein [Planctomycetota bacterium]